MQPQSTDHDETAPPTSRWEDIDSELTCSTREVCFGYGSLAPADVMAVLRDGGSFGADGEGPDAGQPGLSAAHRGVVPRESYERVRCDR
jgi:hypothetical protein